MNAGALEVDDYITLEEFNQDWQEYSEVLAEMKQKDREEHERQMALFEERKRQKNQLPQQQLPQQQLPQSGVRANLVNLYSLVRKGSVVVEDESRTYIDIGHKNFYRDIDDDEVKQSEKLWVIRADWSFEVIGAGGEAIHWDSDSPERVRGKILDITGSIASGRYEEDRGVKSVSAIFNGKYRDEKLTVMELMKKRVVQILEDNFGYDIQIHFYR
jgi:hypothetical protein